LGKTGKLAVPRNAQVVDATGKFLIPGLWDMHAHLEFSRNYLSLFTANGVTGIRVMWGDPRYQEWRREISAGQLIGPRMVISSSVIGFTRGDFPDGDPEDEGRKIVRKVKAEGADFVKVYNFTPRDAYFAIADEAKKQGIPFAGHVPFSVTAAEASDAGQLSIEHHRSIWWGCSPKEEQLRTMGAEDRIPGALTDIWAFYSEQKATELFARFVKNNTWVCPTVLCGTNSAFRGVEDLANDPGLEYVPLSSVEAWHSRLDARAAAVAAMATEDVTDVVGYFQKQLDVIDAMRGAGVGLLAGTDTPIKFCLPGFSLHEELILFVKAGLSPMEALRTATYNPAKFFGKLDSMGTIEQGKIADLVLLEADPLRDISNTQKIAAVVFGGKLSDKPALPRMLAQVKASHLHYAAATGNIEHVKLLIAEGANVNAKDQQGRTPASAALYAQELAVTDLLLEKGADAKDPYMAAYTGNLKEIKNLLEKKTSADSPNGFTLLHAAATGGHADVIQFLISKGFEATATTEDDATPLHYASTVSVAEFCVSNGADVNAKKNNGQSPLHYAARKGHKEIVELLLAHGADVNIGAGYNRTAAEFAMRGNHTEVVELLISKGADISPLHLAIYMKDEAKARSLIENGADVNSRTPEGTTPLNRAIGEGLKDITELLISRGADVNAGHFWGWTPLHGAAQEGHKDIVILLIARGANVNAIDGGGRIPLWYAREKGHTEIIQLLRKN
jgi:ankyrin repeat protein